MTRNTSTATKLGVLSLLLVLTVLGYVAIDSTSDAFAAPGLQDNGTVVSVQPPSQTIGVGDTATVDIQVDNVTDLFGVDLRISFDPSIVKVVDANPLVPSDQVEPGSFLDISGGKGFVVENSADNAAGTIAYAATLLSPAPPVSGSGPIIRITFEGLAEGESAITLESVLLSDAKAEAISATKENGSIRVAKEEQPEGNVIITGTVQNCSGRPVAGASVFIVESPGASATTDANGNYVITANLTLPAEYTVEVSHPQFFSPSRKTTGLIQLNGKDPAGVVVNFTGVDCLKDKPTPSPTPTFTPTLTPTPTITPTPTRQKPQTLLILDGAATDCYGNEIRDSAVVEIVTPKGGVVSSQKVSHRGEYFFYEDWQGLEGVYWIRIRFDDGTIQYLKDIMGDKDFTLVDIDGDGDIDSDDLAEKEMMRQLNFTGKSCVKKVPPEASSADEGKQCVYVVRYGETLYSISRKLGVSVADLAKANGIYNPHHIRAGMKLIIPGCDGGKPAPAHEKPKPMCKVHVVKPGETLYGIARYYGVSVYDLSQANHIVNPWYIRAGMKLTICPKPGYDAGYKPDHGDKGYGYQAGYHPDKGDYDGYHIVKPGETVYSIAMYYGVPPQRIVYLNNLPNPHTIWPGQKLRIY